MCKNSECESDFFHKKRLSMRREALSHFFRRFLFPSQKRESFKVEIVNIDDFAHVVKMAFQLYDLEDFVIVTHCSFCWVFTVSLWSGFWGLRLGHRRSAHKFSKLWKYRHVLTVFCFCHSAEICIRMIWHKFMFRLHWKSKISIKMDEILSYSQDLCSSRSTTKAAKTYGQGT